MVALSDSPLLASLTRREDLTLASSASILAYFDPRDPFEALRAITSSKSMSMSSTGLFSMDGPVDGDSCPN